jgi:hypothetical protein
MLVLSGVAGPSPCRGERACVSVVLRAISAGAQAPVRSNQADKVEGETAD